MAEQTVLSHVHAAADISPGLRALAEKVGQVMAECMQHACENPAEANTVMDFIMSACAGVYAVGEPDKAGCRVLVEEFRRCLKFQCAVQAQVRANHEAGSKGSH